MWGAAISFMKKKDGSMHMCIDYLQFNIVMVKNMYPRPSVYDLFNQLRVLWCVHKLI